MVADDDNASVSTQFAAPSDDGAASTDDAFAATRADAPSVVQQPRELQRYRILGEHGRGGLGRVSRAHDLNLGRDVAIKEVIASDPLSEARFLREARITARLEHPGIVPIYEAGRWPDGTPFYAMKLVAGRPLRELIAERSTVDERIVLLHHVIAVADAMAYAHDQGIIHRDLKPANVIVGDFGETIVIDWGLAKDLATPAEALAEGSAPRIHPDDHLTNTGCVLGTPAYMAPEQERGEQVDQRADVFAIGAMLWELCSLQRVPPIEPGVRHRMLRRAGIDRDLTTIIDRSLARDQQQRYPHAGALAADLKAFKSGARINARSYSLFAMFVHWTRRHRALAFAVLTVLILVLVSATSIGIMYRNSLETRVVKQAAELSFIQGEVEQGRQALLHDDSAEALTHLTEAYRRGERSPSLEFMLARALQQRKVEVARFQASSGRMWSATFSPDGKRVVATDDEAARVWDAESSTLLFTLPHGDNVYNAIYNTDGTQIITASGDGTIRLWGASAGNLVREFVRSDHFDKKPHRYFMPAISRDGKFIAAIDKLGAIVDVWDTNTGALLAELLNDGSGTPSLAFSADGQWLAASGGDVVHIFYTKSWAQTTTLTGSQILSLSFDPTGPRLATGSFTGDAAVWAIPSGKRLRHLREFGEPIYALAFSPDGELVVTGSNDGAAQVWKIATGRLQSQLNYPHGKITCVEFDATSKLVLLAGSTGAVIVGDAAQGELITALDGPRNVVRTAHFHTNSRQILAASWDGTARIWDSTSPYRLWSSPPLAGDCNFNPNPASDGRFVAVGCDDHATQIWDTSRDQLLAELPRSTEVEGDFMSADPAVASDGSLGALARGNAVEIYALPGSNLIRTIPHPGAVSAVAFANTGHDLVSGSVDGTLLVTREGQDSKAMPMSAGGIDALAFLADGRVVAADTSQRLRVIDSARNTVLADLAVPARLMSLRPSPDGRLLISIPSFAIKTSPPALWDLERYRLVTQLDGHIGRVFSARFVVTGEIVTAGGDGTVRRWDLAGHLVRTYRGSSRFLADGVLDPSGTLIVGGGGDGLLRFWDASSGLPLWTIQAHKSFVYSIHFEGDDIVTRGFVGDIAHWRLPKPEQVIATCEACNARYVGSAGP